MPRVVPHNGGFDLDNWLPHEFSFIANHISAALEGLYSKRYGISVTGWRIIAVLASLIVLLVLGFAAGIYNVMRVSGFFPAADTKKGPPGS